MVRDQSAGSTCAFAVHGTPSPACFRTVPALGLSLEQLPVPALFRKRLIRRHRSTLAHNLRSALRREILEAENARITLDIHFTPLHANGAAQDVLIIFQVTGTSPPGAADGRPRSKRASRRKTETGKRGRAKRPRRT